MWQQNQPMRPGSPMLIMARTVPDPTPIREEISAEEAAALAAVTRPEDRQPSQQIIIR